MTPDTEVRADALHLLSNGLYILTTCLEQVLHGATVTWVSQVSTTPPLVLVALRRNSHLAHSVRTGHRFALNILAADQHALAETFLSHLSTAATADRLNAFAVRLGVGHCPLLTDAMAWLECRLASELESPGDHTLFIGEVTGSGVRRQAKPMVLGETPWSYGGSAT